MEDLKAEKPNDVIDVENRLWTNIVPQLTAKQQKQDVQGLLTSDLKAFDLLPLEYMSS